MLGWSCHHNWPQPSCPWESNPHSSQDQSDLSGDWGQEGPASQLCPEQVLSPNEYISWGNLGDASPQETLDSRFLQMCCVFNCPGPVELCQKEGSLVPREGPTECSQMAEERSDLISWSAATLSSKESRPQVRKGKSNNRQKGPEFRLGEETPTYPRAPG